MAMLAALAGLLVGFALPATAAAQGAESAPAVTIGFIDGAIEVAELAAIEGVSPGLMSAGLGSVPATQTYLDITQGNRINPSLYPDSLPLVYTLQDGVPPELWPAVI